MLKKITHWIAYGFGSGLLPKAPGTWGTLAAIPFYYFIFRFLNPFEYAALLVVTFLLGVGICHISARDLGTHDHPIIVWDEMVGYWLSMWLAPQNNVCLSMAIGFVLFRLFDVWKPWPIRWCDQNIHGGLGIMLDDMLAGALACCCLQGMQW